MPVATTNTWGGRRPGAGRKPKPGGPYSSHGSRPKLQRRYPVLVTTRVRAGVPNLREPETRRVLERAFAASGELFGFRLVHYAIRAKELCLIVELEDQRTLARGMKGLLVRTAKSLNRSWSRSGSVFSDRYLASVLRTPQAVRDALVEVLRGASRRSASADPYSSGPWFDGWERHPPYKRALRPCASPETWLLHTAWRKLGPIRFGEGPRAKAEGARAALRSSRSAAGA